MKYPWPLRGSDGRLSPVCSAVTPAWPIYGPDKSVSRNLVSSFSGSEGSEAFFSSSTCSVTNHWMKTLEGWSLDFSD